MRLFLSISFLLMPGLAFASPEIPKLQELFEGAPAVTAPVPLKVSMQEERKLKKPLPEGVKPKISEPAPKTGFSVGFLAGEFIPMVVMQTPYAGKPIGGLLFFPFFPVALVFGAIGWLVGMLL